LYFLILFIGVRLDIKRYILPFGFRCSLACLMNLRLISSPSFPPVVASWLFFGSFLSLGKYGALKHMMSYFSVLGILSKRFVFIVLKPFSFANFIAFGFMSAAVMSFIF